MKNVGSINHESLQTIRRNNIEKVSQINWAKNYPSSIAVVRKCGGKWAREPPFVSRGQNPSSLAAAEPSATGAVAAARRTSHSSPVAQNFGVRKFSCRETAEMHTT